MRAHPWYRAIPSSSLIGLLGFALAAFYAIFHLPFRFPPATRSWSASYVFGFNNSVAIVSIVLLLALAALIYLLRHGPQQAGARISFARDVPEAAPRLPVSLYYVVALLYLLLTALMYWRAQGDLAYGIDWESSHFLWRLKLMDVYGLRPYLDFQSDYGPALVYLPAYAHRLLRPLSFSYEASYYACHYVVNLLGVFCLYDLLNRAVMPMPFKKTAFLTLSIASFAPYMGLNGVSTRFLMPYLSLVVCHRLVARSGAMAPWSRRLQAFVAVFLATALNVAISADVGIAFSLAWLAYSAFVLRGYVREVIPSLFALASAQAFCYLLLPSPYYEALFNFSRGAHNFPLLPAAHLVFYIITLFLTVPALLAAGLRKDAEAPLVFALGALSVALIPGAFGRCDPPHVFFYGLGVCLLTFIRMANRSKRAFLLYTAAYIAVFVVGLQLSNARVFYGVSLRPHDLKEFALSTAAGLDAAVRRGGGWAQPAGAEARGGGPGEVSHLVALEKYGRLGLPFGTYGIDKVTEEYLWSRKKLAPEYYTGAVSIYNEADLSAKARDVSRNEYLLVRKGWETPWTRDYCDETRRYLRASFIYPVTLPCLREGVEAHLEVSRYVAGAYQVVEEAGNYVVMRRVEAAAGSDVDLDR